MTEPGIPYWEQPEVVAEFSTRAPDVRLVALLEGGAAIRRALDVGCAGGRNTVLLAERGVEVHALDASAAMVAETRRRLAGLIGGAAAAARVRQGVMDDLSAYPDMSFDLVLALGVWHSAGSWSEWERAVTETARVLADDGIVLVSQFTPETDLTGDGVRPRPGDLHVYEGLPNGPGVLLNADDLRRELSQRGIEAVGAVETLVTEREGRRRVSATGRFGKRAGVER